MARYDAIVAAEEATRVALWGASMGGYTSLRWAARNPSQVASLNLFFPLSDMGALWDGHPEQRASVEAVWPDPHDSALNLSGPAGAPLAGIPTRIWYSENDPTVPAETVHALAARIGASCELFEQSVGHAVAEPLDIAEVSSHIWAHP